MFSIASPGDTFRHLWLPTSSPLVKQVFAKSLYFALEEDACFPAAAVPKNSLAALEAITTPCAYRTITCQRECGQYLYIRGNYGLWDGGHCSLFLWFNPITLFPSAIGGRIPGVIFTYWLRPILGHSPPPLGLSPAGFSITASQKKKTDFVVMPAFLCTMPCLSQYPVPFPVLSSTMHCPLPCPAVGMPFALSCCQTCDH